MVGAPRLTMRRFLAHVCFSHSLAAACDHHIDHRELCLLYGPKRFREALLLHDPGTVIILHERTDLDG